MFCRGEIYKDIGLDSNGVYKCTIEGLKLLDGEDEGQCRQGE